MKNISRRVLLWLEELAQPGHGRVSGFTLSAWNYVIENIKAQSCINIHLMFGVWCGNVVTDILTF